MLNKERAGDIFDRIRKYSTADEVEVLFYGGKSALTRFANNTIHQNVAEDNYGMSVRTAFDGRTASGTHRLLLKFPSLCWRRIPPVGRKPTLRMWPTSMPKRLPRLRQKKGSSRHILGRFPQGSTR